MIPFPVVSTAVEDGVLRATVRIPDDCAYCDGHFPGGPVLPAVAQLALVEQIASAWRNEVVSIEATSALRFRRPLVPGEEVRVTLRGAAGAEELPFELSGEHGLVSRGRVVLRRPS